MESNKKICKLEKLKSEIEKYRNILSKNMYEYFQALINLEASAIDNTICNSDKELLSCLPFYKSIVKYNIYNNALKVLNEHNIKLLQEYDYRNKKFIVSCDQKLPNTPRMIDVLSLSIDKNNDIELELFNSMSDDSIKNKEIIQLQRNIYDIWRKNDKLSAKYSEIELDDYSILCDEIWDDLIIWNYEIMNHNFANREDRENFELYFRVLKKLKSRESLSENDQEEINKANLLYKSFINQFNIDELEFLDDKSEYIIGASHKYMNKVKTLNNGNVKVISNNYYL